MAENKLMGEPVETDVPVIGYGGAGACAAIAAHDAGAKVLVLEKMPQPSNRDSEKQGRLRNVR